MPLPPFTTSDDERVVAGVCAGVARTLAVDVTLVRLVFALLALAGGAGIILYFALWAYSSSERAWWAAILGLFALTALLSAVGLSDSAVIGIVLVAGGLRASPGDRAGASGQTRLFPTAASRSRASVRSCCSRAAARRRRCSRPAPSRARCCSSRARGSGSSRVDRDAERAARIRSDERSEVAARVHDSVLQTLALIQRHAQEPRRVASLARRQERELRGWLYGERPLGDEASLVGALSAAAADVEELHGVRVELTNAGDCPATRRSSSRRARR